MRVCLVDMGELLFRHLLAVWLPLLVHVANVGEGKLVECMKVGIFECGQARLIILQQWWLLWWSGASNWMGSARAPFPFFCGDGDFPELQVSFFGELGELLLGVEHIFSQNKEEDIEIFGFEETKYERK